jgi:hypothetical protein
VTVRKHRGSLFFFAGLLASLSLGWVAFPRLLYRASEQPVRFSHRVHATDAGLACEDCHPLLPDGRFAGLPTLESCAGCHREPVGKTEDERRFVADYVARGREVSWLASARQPDNVRFPHAVHVRLGGVKCEACHGPQQELDAPRRHEVDRISGYSREIWGPSLSRMHRKPWEGKKMTDCCGCHAKHGVAESCLDCHR